eukprot:Gb_35562 [translate_table: standard]
MAFICAPNALISASKSSIPSMGFLIKPLSGGIPQNRREIRHLPISISDFYQHGQFKSLAGTRRRNIIICEVVLEETEQSVQNEQIKAKIGAKVKVRGPLKVYHVPKTPELDLGGLEGEVKDYVGIWKGKRISANLPYKVQFNMESKVSTGTLLKSLSMNKNGHLQKIGKNDTFVSTWWLVRLGEYPVEPYVIAFLQVNRETRDKGSTHTLSLSNARKGRADLSLRHTVVRVIGICCGRHSSYANCQPEWIHHLSLWRILQVTEAMDSSTWLVQHLCVFNEFCIEWNCKMDMCGVGRARAAPRDGVCSQGTRGQPLKWKLKLKWCSHEPLSLAPHPCHPHPLLLAIPEVIKGICSTILAILSSVKFISVTNHMLLLSLPLPHYTNS